MENERTAIEDSAIGNNQVTNVVRFASSPGRAIYNLADDLNVEPDELEAIFTRVEKAWNERHHRTTGDIDPKASDHQNALKAQRKAIRKKHELIVWEGTLSGLTLRQIANDNPGLSAAAACRMKAKVLRKWAADTEGFIEKWTDIETARAEDRTRIVTAILLSAKDNPELRLQCIDRLEKISARLSKLLGLDAATQLIVTREVMVLFGELAGAIDERAPGISDEFDAVLKWWSDKK
jgi:hypothetical protein